MSLNQIYYSGPGDTIDKTLNLKAHTIQVDGNINVPYINGAPYTGGSVNVGTPRQLLQTNSAGTSPEWTSNIKVINCEVDGQINLNGNNGTNGQVIVKSAGVPTWGSPTISLPSIPVGTSDQILTTNSSGTAVVWSSSTKVTDSEVDGQLIFSGDSGVDGDIIIKAAGVPTWGTPTFTLPSIPVGTARQLLQTNSAGTAAEWTSNVQVIDCNITGNLQTSGVTGSSGNVLTKAGSSQVWSNINVSSINPGTANYILVTNSSGTSPVWSNTASIVDPKFSGNMTLNGGAGVSNQYIKKNGTTQVWSYLAAGDIGPGLANQALLTNGSGTGSIWGYIPVNSLAVSVSNANKGIFTNSAGNAVAWTLVQPESIQPGSINQILTTNSSGDVEWSSSTPPAITPGSAYQILQTNSSGTGVEWTSQFRGTSVLFNSNNQSSFDRYWRSSLDLPIYIVPIGGSTRFDQGITAKCEYVIIGKAAYLTIYPFTISTAIGSTMGYVALAIDYVLLIPEILAPGPSNNPQMTIMCSTSTNNNTNVNPSFANIYCQYYSFGSPYLEITASNSGTYDPNGNHGGTFIGGAFGFMSLKSAFTIQYFLN